MYNGELILKARGFHDNSVEFYLEPQEKGYAFTGYRAGSLEYATRFYAVIYEINDEGLPVNKNPPHLGRMKLQSSNPQHAVTSAVILCRDSWFQNYMLEKSIAPKPKKRDAKELETFAKLCILRYCGIESRSELKSNADARSKFIQLRREYYDYKWELQNGESFQG